MGVDCVGTMPANGRQAPAVHHLICDGFRVSWCWRQVTVGVSQQHDPDSLPWPSTNYERESPLTRGELDDWGDHSGQEDANQQRK
jgi:hypothetical protein